MSSSTAAAPAARIGAGDVPLDNRARRGLGQPLWVPPAGSGLEAAGTAAPDFASTEPLDEEDLDAPGAVTLDTPIQSHNIGYKLLKKMGWADNTGLGKNGQGMVEPVKPYLDESTAGLGKQSQWDEYAKAATKQRKLLGIELEQTPELVQQQEIKAAETAAIEADVKSMNRPFYCDICDKQYKNTMEMQAHLNSYDHGHKARFKQMKDEERKRLNTTKEDVLRKQQEADRREQAALERQIENAKRLEAQRLAYAAAMAASTMTTPTTTGGPVPVLPQPHTAVVPTTTAVSAMKLGVAKAPVKRKIGVLKGFEDDG